MAEITQVEAFTCRVPLDSPIHFRFHTITHRDYTVARIETADGYTGAAIGLSRAAPIDLAVIDMVAPVALGHDALEVGSFHERLRRHTAASDQFGILALARSLVDLAMWDVRGKALQAPVWRLLGGASDPAPVLLVEGYELPGESDQQFAGRLAARVEQGYRRLKLEAAGYDDPRVLRRRLELTREQVGEDVELVVDVNGAWGSVREAAQTIRAFAIDGLAWVEDPFPRHRIHDVASLRKEVDVALGAGDDVTSPLELFKLVHHHAVDILRIDVTTLGGIMPTADVIGVARQYELPVSTHAHPLFHQHLTFASPTVRDVEVFPDDRPFEPSHKLVKRSAFAQVVDGHLPAPDQPGLGVDLNLDAVESSAIRRNVASKETP